MELLFVTVIGAGIGIVAALPRCPAARTYGVLLLPAVAGVGDRDRLGRCCSGLGWTFDGGWIWVVSLVAGGVAALRARLILPRVREQSDDAAAARSSPAAAPTA